MIEKDYFYKALDEFVNCGEKKERKAEERTVNVKYTPGREALSRIDYGEEKKDDKRRAEDGISTLVAGARMMADASDIDEGEFVTAVTGFAVKKILKMGLGRMLEGLLDD